MTFVDPISTDIINNIYNFITQFIFTNTCARILTIIDNLMNRDNKSASKSNDDVYSRVDILKSDSNLNTLPFRRKSTE